MVELVPCIYDYVALKRCASVGRGDLECVQFKDVLVFLGHWLCAPEQFHVRGEQFLGICAVDDGVHCCGVSYVCISQEAVGRTVDRLEYGEEGVLLLEEFALVCLSLCRCLCLCVVLVERKLRLGLSLFCCRLSLCGVGCLSLGGVCGL